MFFRRSTALSGDCVIFCGRPPRALVPRFAARRGTPGARRGAAETAPATRVAHRRAIGRPSGRTKAVLQSVTALHRCVVPRRSGARRRGRDVGAASSPRGPCRGHAQPSGGRGPASATAPCARAGPVGSGVTRGDPRRSRRRGRKASRATPRRRTSCASGFLYCCSQGRPCDETARSSRRVPLQHLADERADSALRRRGRRRCTCRRSRCSRRGVGCVPGVLGVHQPLELAAVEEDPAALGALVDVDAVALVGAHRAVALGTGRLHVGKTSARPRRSSASSPPSPATWRVSPTRVRPEAAFVPAAPATPAPMTTSPSRSARTGCWPGCAQRYGGPTRPTPHRRSAPPSPRPALRAAVHHPDLHWATQHAGGQRDVDSGARAT